MRGEVPALRTAAAPREALLEHRAVRLAESLGREEDREPAVGDLRRQRDVLRADRGEVDRHVGAQRVDDQLERLAEAGRAGARVGDVVVLAVVLERLLAAEDRADDLDVLARARERLAPGLAVPALRDLRAPRPEAQEDAAAGEEVERRDGRGRRRGRRAGICMIAVPSLIARRASADPRERRDGVRAVRLGRPDGVEAAALRLLGEADPEAGSSYPSCRPRRI